MIDICDFARRPVAPALRPDHRVGAAGPPDDGDLAPAGPGRRDQRLQLPGRGLGVELRARHRLRRPGGLEAVGEDAAHARSPARRIFEPCAARASAARPTACLQVVIGGARVGEALVARRARAAGQRHRQLPHGPRGRRRSSPRASAAALLELGGNNAMIVAPSADLDLAVARDPVQRGRHRRPALHLAAPPDRARGRLRRAARRASSRPMRGCRSAIRCSRGTLVGPLIDGAAFERMQAALDRRAREGGTRRRRRARPGRRAMPDALLRRARRWSRCRRRREIVREETFAPILYVMRYRELDEAIAHAQRRAAGPVVLHLHQRPARGRALPVGRPAATAASPTSTSARAAPRSAARSAARRTPAAAASRAPTPGRATCAAPPTRSTTRATCRWPRASCSTRAEGRGSGYRDYCRAKGKPILSPSPGNGEGLVEFGRIAKGRSMATPHLAVQEAAASHASGIEVSVISPVYDEEASITALAEQIVAVMDSLGRPYEIILINDGSQDGSAERLAEAAQRFPTVTVLNLARNYGQTAAMMAGIDAASRRRSSCRSTPTCRTIRATSRCCSPSSRRATTSCRAGARTGRMRRCAASCPAARQSADLDGSPACISTTTAARSRPIAREVLQGVRLYGEMHRFIPIYAAWEGAQGVRAARCSHHPRRPGARNTGSAASLKVLLDIVVVKFLDRYMTKPIYVFGGFGLAFLALSVVSGIYALWLKLVEGVSFISTPLPLLVDAHLHHRSDELPDGAARRDAGAHLLRIAGQEDLCGEKRPVGTGAGLMCGIAGFVGPGDRDSLARMTRVLQHRGPDGEGLYVDPDMPVFLGHRRLAIIDIAGGTSPCGTVMVRRHRRRLQRRDLQSSGAAP